MSFLKKSFFGITPIFLVLFLAFSLVLYFNPAWDIKISSFFYNNTAGFYLRSTWWAYIVYRGVHIASFVMCTFYISYLIVSYKMAKPNLLGFNRKDILYLLIVFILGPGLIINVGLKNNIGRARPATIEYFHGDKDFTPAFALSDQCDTNCSFVSGHASFGYYWVSLGFIASSLRKKKIAFTLSIIAGFIIGMVRVVQGRHFFSDIILAFFFVYISAAFIHYIMYIKLKDKNF